MLQLLLCETHVNCDTLFYMCQTLEELPLDSDVPPKPLHTAADATGLPPISKPGSASAAMYGMSNGDVNGNGVMSPVGSGYMLSPRNPKTRRSFAEHLSASANGGISSNSNGHAVGAGYPTIKGDR